MSAIDRNCHFQTEFVATEIVKPRTLFQRHGRVYQVCGEDAIEPGELVVGYSDRRSEITKGAVTNAFAQDADVFYGTDANAYVSLAAATAASVAATGAGSVGFKAGKAEMVSAAGVPTVMVFLNF